MWVLLSRTGEDEARCVARVRAAPRAAALLDARRAAGDSEARLYRAAEGAAPPLDETASLARWAIRMIAGAAGDRPPEERALLLALASEVSRAYVGQGPAVPDTAELRTAAALATVPAAWIWPPPRAPAAPAEERAGWLLTLIATVRGVAGRAHSPDCLTYQDGACDCGRHAARRALAMVPAELRP